MKWIALVAGAALVVVAFLSAGRVADTREGLIFEVITLLGGLAGVGLLLYGLYATATRSRTSTVIQPSVPTVEATQVRSVNELLIGGAGLVIATLLVTGIATTNGVRWALLGLIMLLPMIVGCAYLCYRFARAPEREWKIDLQKLTRIR